jgi:recombination protein RecR
LAGGPGFGGQVRISTVDSINKLGEYFSKFPGIGPRQSKRFVYYLLRQRKESVDELITLLKKLKEDTKICASCSRYFPSSEIGLCSICADRNRSNETLMVVEKDIDVDNIERSGVFTGKYFVLGGIVSPLDKNPGRKIRIEELKDLIKKKAKNNTLREIIMALSANPDGEETTDYVVQAISPLLSENKTKISRLGRGLSTGSELEYSDTETIKNAFARRT